MKILIMCEGANELAVVNMLLDDNRFTFSRDDLLDMRPFHARQLDSPQLKPALNAYHGDLGMISKGDIILGISNSGQTDEILRLIPFLQV